MADKEATLSPCPFSRAYAISHSLAWRSLSIFWAYRLILAAFFIGLYLFRADLSPLGEHDRGLFAVAGTAYFSLILLSGVLLALRRPAYAAQAQLQVFTDVIAIPIIMHASGGIESGIGVLLALSVAGGALLIGGRCALLFAALASLAILSEQLYADLTDAFTTTAYTYSGMLGAAYFTIALLALVLARRAERSEAIAVQRGIDLANLQQLNEYIIQHLHSGIVAVDEQGMIRMLNPSARRLLGGQTTASRLDTAQPVLFTHFRTWLRDRSASPINLETAEGASIQLRFSRLGDTQPATYLIFLEDSALHNQRVQQSKLASLGRLTASIAHEIRNPLSAIRHASQLLAECESLDKQERRLTEIIVTHTERVNSIIENVLQVSRRTPSQRRNLALYDWLVRFVHDFQAEHPLHDSPFELIAPPDDMQVFIDSGHLKQVLENLCVNALKHGTPEHRKVILRARRQSQHGTPCIEVIDNGPGIDAENVSQIFEPFFTTSASGAGLGLYIARELAELNQAKLDYEAASGGGSCFRISLADAEKPVIEL